MRVYQGIGPTTFERLALCPVLNEDRPPQECIIDQDEGMQCALYRFVLEEHILLPLWLTLLLVTIMSIMEHQLGGANPTSRAHLGMFP